MKRRNDGEGDRTGQPLLSICIPTYNRSEQLRRALESLVGQEGFSEVEVVISDNCSTDGTEEGTMRLFVFRQQRPVHD